ncbi:multidrug transporter [Rhodanobacter denitrificans]|uniref:Multidrug transporter n=1 Tax=Rhodanobacter denitrificans TaxID=666685 RepID=A0A368KHH5_9GAMM|nr:SapC family protein [Rhodanobacter denitrificans]RCS31360.1 multidrug transporter [Rhodanobacter denitrificans]
MAEVLFYERPVPLNRNDHKNLRMKAVPNVKFAMNAHSVPLTGVEFGIAARDLLILFAGTGVADAGPIALLGLRQNENLYVDANGQWAPDTYIPAFVRRYPFVLAEKPAGQDGDDFTVFLDEQYEGFSDSEGQRLFQEDGTDSELLTNAVGFLGEFQQNVARTKWFMEQLVKHDLLEARNVQLQKEGKDGQQGRSINLNGLFVINEQKLRELDEKTTQEFLREGVLGWVYAHLLSLTNIDRLARRLDVREEAEAAAGATN